MVRARGTKSNNDDKHDHGQEKRRPYTLCGEIENVFPGGKKCTMVGEFCFCSSPFLGVMDSHEALREEHGDNGDGLG